MIKAVIFDWGGVLIDEPGSAMYSYFADKLGVERGAFIEVYKKFRDRFQKGLITEDELFGFICSELGINKPESGLWYNAFKAAYRPKKDMFILVEKLKKNGYKTGFLSNTELPAERFFSEQGYEMFDAAIFSCSEGTRKPEKKIYLIVLDRLGVEPDEAVFIDDRENLIEGAKAAGINTILFKSPEQVKSDLIRLSINID